MATATSTIAVCVTIAGQTADELSTRVYSCGDRKVDRCTNPIVLLGTERLNSTADWCFITNPVTGQFGGEDTQATCNISQISRDLNKVDVSGITLINTCSYPSQEPNSDPSDCVFTPGNAVSSTVTQVKNTNGGDPDTNIADDGSVPIGTVAYDTAALLNTTDNPTGTVTYYVELGDASCSIAGATSLGVKTVGAGGAVPNSNTFTLTAPGTYEFWAVYSGGPGNNGSTSTCGSETVTAFETPALSTITKVATETGFTRVGQT